jgi:hypothetical protein
LILRRMENAEDYDVIVPIDGVVEDPVRITRNRQDPHPEPIRTAAR